MSNNIIKQARELVAAATKGDWSDDEMDDGALWVQSVHGDSVSCIVEHIGGNEADMRLIAAAPSLLAQLADELERIREHPPAPGLGRCVRCNHHSLAHGVGRCLHHHGDPGEETPNGGVCVCAGYQQPTSNMSSALVAQVAEYKQHVSDAYDERDSALAEVGTLRARLVESVDVDVTQYAIDVLSARSDGERDTAEDIAAWLDVTSEGVMTDNLANIAKNIRAGAWRKEPSK